MTPKGEGTDAPVRRKVTAPRLTARKGKAPITMVTAYDFTMARLLDEAGVDALLVGDSLGMVVQGQSTTIPVTLEEVCYHTRAVARGAQGAHVVADMPFMSFQVSPEQALVNAGVLMKDGMAESVKLEGGEEVAEHVRRITRAGIPVMGHVGLTPQSVHALGGFKVQGKDEDGAERLVADAIALEEAGAYAIVLEAMPPDVAARVTEALRVPTIGIGAGAECDGQVLVCYDLLGMSSGHRPKFAKAFAPVGDAIREAARAYVTEVQARAFPGAEHSYAPSQKDGQKQARKSGTKLAAV
ncbi:MAG: 3-methyl-2-oxobutanoate hydroxymethyltransferase [Myxococcales bacterium]|nr:3-methyl-2-oxobutanoate hydroxymethyltransferase [Myxococcales bacterium]